MAVNYSSNLVHLRQRKDVFEPTKKVGHCGMYDKRIVADFSEYVYCTMVGAARN